MSMMADLMWKVGTVLAANKEANPHVIFFRERNVSGRYRRIRRLAEKCSRVLYVRARGVCAAALIGAHGKNEHVPP